MSEDESVALRLRLVDEEDELSSKSEALVGGLDASGEDFGGEVLLTLGFWMPFNFGISSPPNSSREELLMICFVLGGGALVA
jgi:hypothetical protein